jgi:hypothetical protein
VSDFWSFKPFNRVALFNLSLRLIRPLAELLPAPFKPLPSFDKPRERLSFPASRGSINDGIELLERLELFEQ